MTCNTELYPLGREERFFLKKEATCGVFVKPVSADAMKILSSSMGYGQERVNRDDKDATTRDRRERLSRREEMPWGAESYFIPSGSAGVLPDMSDALEAAFGQVANDYTTITYSFNQTQHPPSLQIAREESRVSEEVMNGCRVDELTLSGSGGDEVKCSFSGHGTAHNASHRAHFGTTDGVNNRIQLTEAGDYELFEADTVVALLKPDGTYEDNGGAGYHIDSVDQALNRLTLAAGEIPPALTTLPVCPWLPAETTVGSPALAIIGSVTLDGVEVPVMSWSITVRNNLKVINDEFGSSGPSDMLAMIRDVEGNLALRLRRDQAIHYAKSKSYTGRNLIITWGSLTTGGRRCRFLAPNIEFTVPEIEVPQEEEVTISMDFVALQNAVANDSATLTID